MYVQGMERANEGGDGHLPDKMDIQGFTHPCDNGRSRKRKNLTDVEVATAIKEYDELKRKIEGSAKRGQQTDLTSSKFDEVWTRDKTAKDLGISTGAVSTAIQIANAIEENPKLIKKPKRKKGGYYGEKESIYTGA